MAPDWIQSCNVSDFNWNRLVLESEQTVFHISHFDSVYLKNFKFDSSIIFTEKSRNHTYDFSKRTTIQIFWFLWEILALELLNPFFGDTLYFEPWQVSTLKYQTKSYERKRIDGSIRTWMINRHMFVVLLHPVWPIICFTFNCFVWHNDVETSWTK